ncbi:MAG: hypothetical protein ACPG4Z_00975 [Chitinophagales bacterium]
MNVYKVHNGIQNTEAYWMINTDSLIQSGDSTFQYFNRVNTDACSIDYANSIFVPNYLVDMEAIIEKDDTLFFNLLILHLCFILLKTHQLEILGI